MPQSTQRIPPRATPTPEWHSAWHRSRTLAAAICSLGGTIFGYDLGALSGAAHGLNEVYGLSPALLGLTISASLWGAVCASPIAGRLADRVGRRGLLAWCAFAYGLAACCLATPVAWPWCMVIGLRCLAGGAIGGFVVVCPLYLAEISPSQVRGQFVGWFQMQIGIGVVLAFAVSAMLAGHLAESAEWRWCFGLGAIPATGLLLLLHWVPEEPHWLAGRGRTLEAASVAVRLGLPADWLGEVMAPGAPYSRRTREERLFSRKYLRPLLLATSAALFNQLCGVTILRVYLLDLLSSAGMGRALSHHYSILISILNLFALLLGMALVDRIGRKPLLLIGSAGMAVCFVALTVALRSHATAGWYPVILVAYNTFFAASQGAVTWVFLSEIFPYAVRGKGQGFGALIHWIANAGLIWFFPVLQNAMPQSCFLVFAGLMVLQVWIVLAWYPETKGTRLGMAAGDGERTLGEESPINDLRATQVS